MKSVKLVLLLSAFLMGCGMVSFADTVKMKDGTTVSGKIIASNETTVMLRNSAGEMVNLPKSGIVEIASGTNALKADAGKENAGKNEESATVKSEKDKYDFDEEARNLIGVGGGIAHQTSVLLGAISLGYEYLLLPNISFGISFSVWPYSTFSMILYDISFNVHILGKKVFDPYFGIGFASGRVTTKMEQSIIDISAIFGVNFWVNKNFGFRVQDKLYLLSLGYGLNETIAEIMFAF